MFMSGRCLYWGLLGIPSILFLGLFSVGSPALAGNAEHQLFLGGLKRHAEEMGEAGPAPVPWPAVRYRQAHLNPAVLSTATIAKDDRLVLNLFGDANYTAHVDSVATNVNGTVTITARVEESPHGFVIISTTGDDFLGKIELPHDDEYYIVQNDPVTGAYYLLETRPEDRDELPCGVCGDPKACTPPDIPDDSEFQERLRQQIPLNCPDEPARLDVMVVYTPAAREWATAQGGIANVIDQAMERGNISLANSNTHITLRLVHTGEVDFAESGNSGDDLREMTFAPPGSPFRTVHQWRDTYGADLVALFALVQDTGGLAWLAPTASGNPAFGYSLTRVQQAANTFTHIHEIGHNMGCGHSAFQEVQPGPGLFSYSSGWRWFDAQERPWATLMAYSDGVYTNIPHFSDPQIDWQGEPSGTNTANNARTVRQTKHPISLYRPTANRHPECHFGESRTIAGWSGQSFANNFRAEKQPCEPRHAGNVGGASLWWRWRAPADGRVTFDTFGSTFDTLLAVYVGESYLNLAEIASNDNAQGTEQSMVTFNARGGVLYHIAVDGRDGATGDIFLNRYRDISHITGTLSVTLGPELAKEAGAQWHRIGSPGWFDSGEEEVNVPVGEHQVIFRNLQGWNAPEGRTVSIQAGKQTAIAADYAQGDTNSVEWTTHLGGPSFNHAMAVALDEQGNVYTAGHSRPSTWTSEIEITAPETDNVFLIKLSPESGYFWSASFGGNGNDHALGVALDAGGNIYIAGETSSDDWFAGYPGGPSSAFVMKVSPEGQTLWGRYLGGTGEDRGRDVAVDPDGNVYITGYTRSPGWIAGGHQPVFQGHTDGFLVKLSTDGDHIWSTYLGGAEDDRARGVRLDAQGNIFVAGETASHNWISGGYNTTPSGARDAFVIKLSPEGQPLWSTYLGGAEDDWALALDVGPHGDVHVTGITYSAGWVSAGFDTAYNGLRDAFVVKLSNEGEHLWSTYLGGDRDDWGWGIAVDRTGGIYVAGQTSSPGWVRRGFDSTLDGYTDAYIAKLSINGDHIWSAYIGGYSDEEGRGVAVDNTGNIYVGGSTSSSGWAFRGLRTDQGGAVDAFVARIFDEATLQEPAQGTMWIGF